MLVFKILHLQVLDDLLRRLQLAHLAARGQRSACYARNWWSFGVIWWEAIVLRSTKKI